MGVLDGLVYDRTAAHVERLKALMRIGWQNMTPEERDEYLNGNGGQLYDSLNEPLFDSLNEPLLVEDGIQRGAYNHTDLNRVEEAVDYVADELAGAPAILQAYASDLGVAWDSSFDLPYDENDYTGITVKTDWTDADIMYVADAARYIGNLQLIGAALPITIVVPASMNGLDYSGANNIERMLLQIDAALADAVEERKALIKGTLAMFYSGELYSDELPMEGSS